MNRATRIAFAAAVPAALALAYPAAAWLIGQQVEAATAEHYRLLDDNPSLKIVRRDYQRGVFSATETLTVELLGNVTQAMARQQREAMAANPGLQLPPVQPILLTFRTRIQHGPFPGLKTFAAAVADSELVLPGELQPLVADVLGEQKPLLVHSEYRFDGSGRSTLSSPAFSTRWQASEGAGRNTLAWDGLTMSIDFDPGMRRFSFRAEAPKLELKASRGGQLTLAGMRLEGTQQRLFDDDPLLYAGTQKLTLARVGVAAEDGAPVEARRVSYEAEIPASGDFIDLIGRLGSESLRIGDQDYGPAHYDFSLRHLHARSAAAFYRRALQLSADGELQAVAQAEPAKLFAPLAGPAMELLRHGPELRVDRISFRSPHGDASLSARLRLKELSSQELANPLALLAKLDASADIALPEGLLGEIDGLSAADAEGDAAVAAEDAAARRELMRQRIAELTAQGLVVRDGGVLRAQLAFRDGQLTVNGKPVTPPALGAPAGAM